MCPAPYPMCSDLMFIAAKFETRYKSIWCSVLSSLKLELNLIIDLMVRRFISVYIQALRLPLLHIYIGTLSSPLLYVAMARRIILVYIYIEALGSPLLYGAMTRKTISVYIYIGAPSSPLLHAPTARRIIFNTQMRLTLS